ncbi:MAG: HPr family phosphocarrier protein [Clostridiales bacterium]|nr:HPr family phosphocarrier protein [Clostridiales bacterium]
MVSQRVTIMNPTGLHARPAANLVKVAKQFQAEITLKAGGQQFMAKDIFSLMNANVPCGTEVLISCDGDDEKEALKTIVQGIEDGLGE